MFDALTIEIIFLVIVIVNLIGTAIIYWVVVNSRVGGLIVFLVLVIASLVLMGLL